jgi:hypothetical protein
MAPRYRVPRMKRSLGMRRINLYVDPELYTFLASEAMEQHRTMSHVAREILADAAKRRVRRKRAERAT